jgi:hypothetical protein
LSGAPAHCDQKQRQQHPTQPRPNVTGAYGSERQQSVVHGARKAKKKKILVGVFAIFIPQKKKTEIFLLFFCLKGFLNFYLFILHFLPLLLLLLFLL